MEDCHVIRYEPHVTMNYVLLSILFHIEQQIRILTNSKRYAKTEPNIRTEPKA